MKFRKSQSDNSIGQRIRELRQKRGITQVQLGQLVGCAQNTVAEWENRAGRAPDKRILGEVAKALEVSVEYLLGIEKVKNSQIPCYGEVLTQKFIWSVNPLYCIEIPRNEYSPNRFSFQVLDSLLEPIISKGDYGIFEKQPPENGDIVVIRFPEDNKGKMGMWRQQNNAVMLLETNLEKIGSPYFFQLIDGPNKDLTYKIQGEKKKEMVAEGKLVAVKRGIKAIKGYSKISYIYF